MDLGLDGAVVVFSTPRTFVVLLDQPVGLFHQVGIHRLAVRISTNPLLYIGT